MGTKKLSELADEGFTVRDISALAQKPKGFVELVNSSPRYKIEPWEHQKEAIKRAKKLKHFALFFEMGAGKTSTAINILRHKYYDKKRLLRTLILCPPIVVKNWKAEFEMHSMIGDHVFCLEGSGKDRIFQMHRAIEKRGDGVIFITNYETLLMNDAFDLINSWQPEAIVFDESHRLKNSSAKRTKLALKLADKADYKYILTGTPILNDAIDLWSQFRVMDGGETLGKNFWVYRAKYFYDANQNMPKERYFPDWKPRPGSFEELNQKIQGVSMVVKKENCLDLPPLVKQVVKVSLSPQQRELYEAMKKDFVAYVGNQACVASLAITKALRMQQIVSGYVSVEGIEGGERTNVRFKENPRAEALEELLDEICKGSKCLVWAVFRENYASIRDTCTRLNLEFVEVHGEVSQKERDAAVRRFNSDPSCRVFIGNPQSAGIGINLVSASYSIFYSRSFSLEQDLQAEARNYRGGSEIHQKITRIDLVAENTIDEVITEKLAQKVSVSDEVLRDIVKRL